MLDEIGAGRFGPVYRAQHEVLGTVVAVKVFDQDLSADQVRALADALDRLCATFLDHAAIVSPVAAGVEGGLPWVAEPYVEGTPLDRLMRRDGPKPLGDVLLRLTQIAGALDFAAAVGVHHGGLHPRDIIVSDEATVLTGLGILQALADAGLSVPMEGAYVSPERALDAPVTIRDDVYALAAITFELVYGQPAPGPGRQLPAMPRVTGMDHGRFREVLERALSQDPAARPATALEFAAALQHVLLDNAASGQASGISAAQTPAPETAVPQQVSLDVEPYAAAGPLDDLPLRRDDALQVQDPGPAWEPAPEPPRSAPEEYVAPLPQRSAPAATPHDRNDREAESESRWWVLTAAMIAIALLTGFAAGFVVGQRDSASTPAPRSAERAVPRANRPAPPPDTPAPTAGRDDGSERLTKVDEPELRLPSESPGAAARGEEGPAVTTPRGSRARTAAAPRPAEARARAAEPARATGATLQVDSRPRGARVFLDGRLVGHTPVTVAEVTPGAHAVRIDLIGYQRWVTTVNVAAGERARVAASLER